jgi:hypothetical protein
VLLILIGLEVLIYLWRNRKQEEEPRIKYDVASILIIIFFGIVSLGFYTLYESGVLGTVKTLAASSRYEVQTSPQIIEPGAHIKKISVIGNPGYVNIHATDEKKLTIYSNWSTIYETSKEKADQIVEGIIDVKESGEALYITVRSPSNFGPFYGQPYGTVTIHVPADMELETDVRQSQVSLELQQQPKNDWSIRSQTGSIIVRLDDNADNLLIKASSSRGRLSQNTAWTEKKGDSEATLQLGKGEYNLRLTSGNGYIDVR